MRNPHGRLLRDLLELAHQIVLQEQQEQTGRRRIPLDIVESAQSLLRQAGKQKLLTPVQRNILSDIGYD